jgi:nucleotide-binding universal stress UspA family protein
MIDPVREDGAEYAWAGPPDVGSEGLVMGIYRTIVVGTDGSDSSFLAVDRAAEVAQESAATLVIVCAYGDEHKTVGRSFAPDQPDDPGPSEDAVRTAGERAVARGASDIERVVIEGEAVSSLLSVVGERHADLLVVGNKGLNRIAGRLLGSVPADVSRRAACDVLIVHTVS